MALFQLGLARNNLRPATFFPLLVLILCVGTATFLLRARRKFGDPLLLPVVFFLSGLGLALISRLAPAFVNRQLVWLVIATGLLLLVTLVPSDLNWLRRYKYTWLISGLLLLSTTLLLGVNPSGFGARLWLQFGPLFFQPSEPLKLLLVVFLAAYLADRRRQLVEIKAYIGFIPVPHPSYFGPMLLMWGFSIVLLIWQRDLGAALLFFGTFLGVLYAATGERRYIGAGTLLLIGAGVLGYYLFDVVRLRVEAFWNPWLDPAGRSFQIVQSLLAFASGGFFGQGLGQGLPTAIPVVHTDFVFAAIGEEYGLLGALGVLLCFGLLISRAFHIGLRARRGFEQLLAIGIGVMLGLQTIIITAGTLKLMPLTGVTLPFVSYGGSSLVTSFIMVGLLLFISARESDQTLTLLSPSYNLTPYTRLAFGLLTGFLIVAGGLILWQILLAPFLINRNDNPRPIIAEQTIRRGRLLTADNIPVAETIIEPDGLTRRHYPYPGLASVTGYYSIRYGVGGTEAAFDPFLRGTAGRSEQALWLDEFLHRSVVGQDIRLTIHLPAQVAADLALDDREGAVVVMDLNTGAILVMSSHPTYNPNELDEQWDLLREDEAAPLLNRATQGLFPVGDLARLIALVGLLESGANLPSDPSVAPLSELVAPLGEAGYLATAHQLGLVRSLDGFRSQPGLLPDFDDKGTVRDLAVTPLHMARVIAALELEGRLIDPVLSMTNERTQSEQIIKSETARRTRALLTQADEDLIGFGGVATPEETGKAFLSWFVGLTPASVSLEPVVYPLPEEELILDPTKIATSTAPRPTPLTQKELRPARYVVVAIVVFESDTDRDLAFRVARAPLQIIPNK